MVSIASPRKRPRLWLAIAAVVVAAGVVVSSAFATTYWFYQGNLPEGDGTVAVHKYNDCCNGAQWIRMSWTAGSGENMHFLVILNNGTWTGLTANYANGYDQYDEYDSSVYSQGGCELPSGEAPVYVNCHEGNTQ